MELELWLIHPDAEKCDAFRHRFAGLSSVKVLQQQYHDLPPHDAFVTAGNSYGIMTAGIDAAVVNYFGPDLMTRVQHRIMDEYRGEQPVGTAFVIETHNDQRPYLVHAPTMRVPSGIDGTDKVYTATWAALLAVTAYNRLLSQTDSTAGRLIRTVVFPALGTGFGSVPADEAARQMAAAWRLYLNPPHRLDWDWVIDRQKSICYDGSRQVVR